MLRVMWRLFSLAVSLVFGAAQRSATRDDTPKARGGWGATGYYAVEDTSRLRLAVCDWMERRSGTHACNLSSGGGGATLPLGPLLVDASGGGMGDRYHAKPASHEFGGGFGDMSVGLPLIRTRALRVYPLVGFGGMGGGLKEYGESGPGWLSAFFTTGIGIDLRIKLGWVGVLVGLRMGYRHEIANMQFGEGPEFEQPGGPFVRFIVGPYFG